MDLTPLHKRVIALDVHQAKITEHDDGRVEVTKQDFGAFKRDRRALAQWALQIRPEVVVMESTGVYWKSPFAALEAVGITAWVVNARHVKAVPGRKTDMADAQWLATLARAGLLRASFIPPLLMRQLRLVARQRQWWACAAPRRTVLKVLVDAGIRINVVVADIHGASARAMVKALIADKPMHEVLDCKGRLRASREELFEALSTEQFSDVHRFVAEEILQHIEQIEQRIARLDARLLQGLKAYEPQLRLLQTIPGIDLQGAAMLLVEIGADMSIFGSTERLASWVGICPGNNESAGKRKPSGAAMPGCAGCCASSRRLRRERDVRSRRSSTRWPSARATRSPSWRWATRCCARYAMLSTGSHYQDKTVDYEALSVARNAPRWLKMLRKHGFIAAPATA